MLCLVGSQGAGKSTFFRFLAMNDSWFSDDLRNLSDAKVFEKLVGHWIIEMAEMIGTSSAKSVEEIKAFLSRLVDNYRDPYGHFPKDRPRQCVFVGTTNTQRFLPLDRTGNRRFFPIPTEITKPEVHILDDEKASRAYIEQLWAEAMVIYRSGNYSLCLSPEMDKEMNIRRVDYMAEDTTTGMIQAWLDEYKGNYVCTYLIYNECFKQLGKPDPKAKTEINSIMNNTIKGWKQGKQHRYPQYGQQRSWERVNEPDPPDGGWTDLSDVPCEQLGIPEEWLKPPNEG